MTITFKVKTKSKTHSFDDVLKMDAFVKKLRSKKGVVIQLINTDTKTETGTISLEKYLHLDKQNL